jgi:hypothetical protein
MVRGRRKTNYHLLRPDCMPGTVLFILFNFISQGY